MLWGWTDLPKGVSRSSAHILCTEVTLFMLEYSTYQPLLAMPKVTAVREQEGVLCQDILNPRDTRVCYPMCFKFSLMTVNRWMQCPLQGRDVERWPTIWKEAGTKCLRRHIQQFFPKELIYHEICVAASFLLLCPNTQLKTTHQIAQNFIFPLRPSSYL